MPLWCVKHWATKLVCQLHTGRFANTISMSKFLIRYESMPQGSCDWWYATVIMGLVVCHSDHGIGSMPQGSWDW